MKILVAEDDALTREAVCDCLRGEGFSVLEAANGADTLALWRAHRPALLCLDIMMPGTDGYEVCRRVRAEDASLPILFLSAKSEEIDVVVGLELGADDFLRKPFGRHELLARVRAALRRVSPSGKTGASFAMAGLTVYPAELRAERAGMHVDLSPREVAILALLRERAGQAVTRDDLLDRCWGQDYYPESRTLDQHIVKLRRKIGDDPTAPGIIETVRGVGYRYRYRAR